MKIIGQLKAILGLDKSRYDQGLNQAEARTNKFSAGIKRLGGIMAAAFSITAIIGFIKKIGQAYDVQAKAERSLLIALKGREDIQQRIIKQAQALQRITLFGDEETTQAAARLAMMLGTNETAIRRLLPLVQDLAVAKFEGNLVTAAELVAKSVGSSTNALSRYGIQIEGTAGSSERLNMAMEALNKQVGGQAQAAAEVGIGAFTQFGNVLSDIMEALGKKPLESEAYKGLTQFGRDFVEILADEDTKFIDALWKSWFRREKTLQEIRRTEGEKVTPFPVGSNIGETIISLMLAYKISLGQVEAGTEVYIKTIADLREEIAGYQADIESAKITDTAFIQTTLKKIQAIEDEIKALTTLNIVRQKGPAAIPTGNLGISVAKYKGTRVAAPNVNKQQADDLTRALNIQNEAVGILSNSFNALFSSNEDGWNAMIDSMISSFKRLIAEILAKAAILGLITLIFPGTAFGAKALTGLKTMFTIPNIASGGMVPPGYPNDTYPAMLSSGETILTPRQSREFTRRMDIYVHGDILGRGIAIIGRRTEMDN